MATQALGLTSGSMTRRSENLHATGGSSWKEQECVDGTLNPLADDRSNGEEAREPACNRRPKLKEQGFVGGTPNSSADDRSNDEEAKEPALQPAA